ncbi:MAG: DUF1772 domain-containing protein [Flavobacteriales bacterium]|nr:DUF1772 domain-containing protein [Flavobacteriales bacterium]
MEITIKSTTLFTAILLTGLSAGLFYAWSVSVIPGIKNISDLSYLLSMKSMNRAILNSLFFLIFFGSLIFLGISSWQQYGNGAIFWFVLSATLLYLGGTFGVTVFGNVPLNDQLEALDLSSLQTKEIELWRNYYEPRWNRLHSIRTVFGLLSFLVVLASTFYKK